MASRRMGELPKMMLSAPSSKMVNPRPTGCLNTAMRDLDKSADAIRALLDAGQLIGFNIAVSRAGRAEWRILTRSIEHYRATGGIKPLILEWPEVFQLILPCPQHFVAGVAIQRGLNCDRSQVQNLIAAGALAIARGARPGPGGSPIITRASYEAFLLERLQ